MMKLIASTCLLALVASPCSDRFHKYNAVEAYEIRPGIMMVPVFAASGDLCEIGIEKRRYSDNRVDMDAAMPEEQIISMFDELVPREERGGLWGNLPADSEIGRSDLGMLTTVIPYKNVSLEMYGKKDRPDRQKYIAAIISWNNQQCNAK
jgi:hypothetical protein